MKSIFLLLPIAIAVLGTAFAQDAATSIPILNPQFEVDKLTCAPSASCYEFGITGWLPGPQTTLFKAGTSQFPGAPAGGIYVAAIGYPSLSTGSIFQTLGATLQANTTYTLKVRLGARADVPFAGYIAALGAGNVTLASGNSATPKPGTFVTEVIVYKSGAEPPQLGQPLQILVRSLGSGQVDVSNVTLTAN
jgi:hypothetical protein